MLEQVEAGERAQDLKMDVLQAIRYVIQGWNNVTAETIYNCWRHTGILPINTDVELDFPLDDDYEIFDDELTDALKALNFSNMMELEEFLTIPEEKIVCEILDDDEIITDLVNNFKKKSNEEETNNLDEMDDSIEEEVISFNVALKSLKKVHTFLLQQEYASEHLKLANTIEKFIKMKKVNSMQQTTINQYFS
jgi:hypothetical protein